ncbi:MAG TPA: NAD(P)H-binding protein, partial [Candidatus Sulfotelmatobacter sp.]|nr:NAD(P)H-binding protein [Candidatus Sulfotelmatobacter sp.]
MSQLQDRLVTVFGGSGFVGRYVVKHLAERGARVRVAVRRPDEALFLKPMGVVGQIVPTPANIRVETSVAAAVAGADAVVNLVAVLYERGRQSFEALHVRGAEVVARQAAAAGARHLVQVSSLSADANSPSAYGRSKAAGEAAVRAAF